jgi:hypothetical protein
LEDWLVDTNSSAQLEPTDLGDRSFRIMAGKGSGWWGWGVRNESLGKYNHLLSGIVDKEARGDSRIKPCIFQNEKDLKL